MIFFQYIFPFLFAQYTIVCRLKLTRIYWSIWKINIKYKDEVYDKLVVFSIVCFILNYVTTLNKEETKIGVDWLI